MVKKVKEDKKTEKLSKEEKKTTGKLSKEEKKTKKAAEKLDKKAKKNKATSKKFFYSYFDLHLYFKILFIQLIMLKIM